MMFLMTCETITGDKRNTELSSGQSLRTFRLTIRLDGSHDWGTGEVNYLAKAVVISSFQARDLEEKVMG